MLRYSQQDERWRGHTLGRGTVTIGSHGCLLTALAMLCNDLGASETPLSLNEKMLAVGGFVESDLIVRLLPQAVPAVSLRAVYACEAVPAPLAALDAHLAAGEKLVVQVDSSPLPALQPHWLILERALPAEGPRQEAEDYEIIDPWPLNDTPPVRLLARYGGSGMDVKSLISYAFVFAAAAETVPLPAAFKRIRIAAAGGINLRLGPSPQAERLATLPPGLELEVLEIRSTPQGRWCVPRLYLAAEYAGDILIKVVE